MRFKTIYNACFSSEYVLPYTFFWDKIFPRTPPFFLSFSQDPAVFLDPNPTFQPFFLILIRFFSPNPEANTHSAASATVQDPVPSGPRP